MCGILAVVGHDSPLLGRALDRLAHRGPDAHGVLQRGAVTLAHRRLSVVDLCGGTQPMTLSDVDVAVTFNGEIYNHLEIRRNLEGRGHQFRSSSDTETLLRAYVEYGVSCVEHLRGMFAFVLHDARNHTLFAARDPFGKKPLYYTRSGSTPAMFAAASEPGALLDLFPALAESIDHAAIASYLLHDYIVGSMTPYSGVRRLLPGHAMVLDLASGAMIERQYWMPRLSEPATSTLGEDEAVDQLQQLLLTAVERRLMADVPVGVLLSGGVDSSLIAALMTKLRGKGTVSSFSMAFEDARFDESASARQVALHVGTVHHEHVFRPEDCLATIESVIERLDEPFADPSVLPTSMICAFARQHVTVALGGDGGDELFAGYDTFTAVGVARAARRMVPPFMDSLIASAASHLPAASGKTRFPLEFKARRFLRGFRLHGGAMVSAWQGPFDAAGLQRLAPGLSAPAGASEQSPSAKEEDSVLSWYQRVYLPDDILYKGDRASMLHSLELRSPFLDLDVAEFVNSLPLQMKFNRGVRKHLLRKTIQAWKLLPTEVLTREKRGFGIPVASWLRGPLAPMLRERLLDGWPAELSMIQRHERESLIQQHQSGQRDLYKELWALLVLSIWGNRWLSRR